MKPINIDPFATVAGHITVGDVKHDVLHLNGHDYRTLNGGSGTMVECYAIAERLVPTLGDKVYELVGAQIGAIIGIADGRVRDVEGQFPNSDGPTMPSDSAAPAPV